jgi:hypothetical protein
VSAVLPWVLLVALGTLLATHLAIVVTLFGRTPRWRGVLALLVPPLALWWASRTERSWLGWLWLAAVATFAAAVAAA